MAVVMAAFAAGRDAQAFVHGYEGEEAHHDGDAEEEVLVGVDEDEACLVGFCFTEKDLGEKVEEGVA